MSTARIGVIGTGWWSTQFHLPGLVANERATVAAFADPDAAKLQAAGNHFDVAQLFTDHRALLDAGITDGVVVAVPHHAHYAIARDCLDAGVHVLLEKPMTVDAADAWDLVRRAESAGLHLVLGYNYQFTPSAQRAREVVQSGLIGDLYLISGLFSSMVESFLRGQPDDYADLLDYPLTGPAASTYADPERGGGQAQTQATHSLGMVLWVTGRQATEVYARMATRGLAVDLVDAITYELDDGCLGTMASTGSIRPSQTGRHELRYYGSDGWMAQDLGSGALEVQIGDADVEVHPPMPGTDFYPTTAPGDCLVDLILGGDYNPAPPGPAAATVELIAAAHRSAATGAPVRLGAHTADHEAVR